MEQICPIAHVLTVSQWSLICGNKIAGLIEISLTYQVSSLHGIPSSSYITIPRRPTFSAALEDSGTPFSYFPVMIPQARGDQDTTPTPAVHHDKHK